MADGPFRKAKMKSKRKKILVIDDDEGICEYVKHTLEEEGYKVTACRNGVQGEEAFESAAFDLVITDIIMPVKDGLCAIIDIQSSYPDVKFLAMSGVDLKDSFLDAASVFGAVHTLKKPFSRQQILWAVADALDR